MGGTEAQKISELVSWLLSITVSYHHTADSRCNRGAPFSLKTPKLPTTKPTPQLQCVCALRSDCQWGNSVLTSTKTNPLGPRKMALYKLLIVDSPVWP